MTEEEFRQEVRRELQKPDRWGMIACGNSVIGIYHRGKGIDLRVLLDPATQFPSSPARVYVNHVETFITTVARGPARRCMAAVLSREGRGIQEEESLSLQRRNEFLNQFGGFEEVS